MKKIIITILGTRPQFIKSAIISKLLKKTKKIDEIILHTGQHYDNEMSETFFNEFKLPRPHFNLNINEKSHGKMTGKMLIKIEEIINKVKPNLVLVYGDTNSTLAGALAASKLNIPLAHIEAGLRSFNKFMPEEVNRIITDHTSNILFAPSKNAKDNLLKEGLNSKNIKVVGDVMYDVALKFINKKSTILKDLSIKSKSYLLATIHRQENADNYKNLKNIVLAFKEFSKDIPVVWPLHPRTKKRLLEYNLFEIINTHVKFIKPQGYINMINLEKNSLLIATDSGGMQKEAYYFKVPCITIRKETEWIELVNSKWNVLCPPSSKKNILKNLRSVSKQKTNKVNLYGTGNSSEKIVLEILNYLNL